MKKFLIVVLSISGVLVVGMVAAYLLLSAECSKLLTVFEIFLQSILTGLITFLGLFFTFRFQKKYDLVAEIKRDCPFIIILPCSQNIVSASMSVQDIDKSIICAGDNADKVRHCQCNLFNAKRNTVLNLEIQVGQAKKNIDFVKETQLDMYLLESEGKLTFRFEDIHGNRYEQTISYQYQNSNYAYTYCQPQLIQRRN